MKKTLLALALALSASFAQAAPAPTSTLFDLLLSGGSITAADKKFTDWTVSFGSKGYSSDPQRTLDTTQIIVTALLPADGGDPLNPGPGLKFEAIGPVLEVTGVGGNQDPDPKAPPDPFAFIDFHLGFKVSVTDPTLQIKDISLSLVGDLSVGSTDANEDLGMFILEDVGTTPGSNDLIIGASAGKDQLGGTETTTLFPGASFAPISEIWVTKNIYVWADAADDTARLQKFEQRFSQTARVVPEPGSLALLTLALAGLGFARRRIN